MDKLNFENLTQRLDELNMLYYWEEYTDDYGDAYYNVTIPQQRYRFDSSGETLLDADVY